VAVAAVVTVLVVFRSSPTRRAAADASTTATLPLATTFRLAGAEVPSTGAKALPDAVTSGVLATLNRYLAGAVVGPLKSGTAAPDLPALFTGAAAQRLTGPDRATLVEEGGPASGRSVRVDDAAATLTALLAPDGSISVVAAKVDVVLRAGGAGTATRVARSGELVLIPDGGVWKIDGYDLKVTRDPVAPATSTSGQRR
jgi:hypothetical protein